MTNASEPTLGELGEFTVIDRLVAVASRRPTRC